MVSLRNPIISNEYYDIQDRLDTYDSTHDNILVGIHNPVQKQTLILQILDSIKRINYIQILISRVWSINRINPSLNTFDPLMAAAWHIRNHNIKEAIWLIFLSIHFGKHRSTGWKLSQAIYGHLGVNPIWNYDNVSTHIDDFIDWLDENQYILKQQGSFSNHRKYQSLSATNRTGTGETIKSFIQILPQLLPENIPNHNASRGELFGEFYHVMDNVVGFGRLAKFDFLTMLGKFNILPIEPDHPYLQGSTGPINGAIKLYGLENNKVNVKDLNMMVTDLGNNLNLYFGMQVLEDSLCNWQKDPIHYQRFRG